MASLLRFATFSTLFKSPIKVIQVGVRLLSKKRIA
jgi:hypothetical protein